MSHDEHFLTPPSGHPQNPVGYPGAINIQITPYQPLNPVVNQHVVGTATSTPPTDNPRNNATNSVSLNPLHRPESLNHRRSHSRRKFDKAIKLAPLSEELLQKVSSPDVSKWKPRDAEMWLEHVFSGASAELFNRYLHFFKQFGVQGIDLLNLSEDTYADMGVTDSIHLNRIRESSEQLLRHQEKLEKDNEDRENTERADFLYTKTKAEYEEKMAQRTDGLPLTLPANMQVWKLIDVFAFFKRPGNEHLEKVFLKTLILSEIDGEKLIRLADPNTRLENQDVSVKNIYSQNDDHAVMRLIGLNAEAIDIKRLKDVINRYRKRQEENVAAARQSAKNELWKNLGSYDPKKLVVQEQIGKGAFGCVYRALYEKKKVVMKILIAKDQSSNRGGQKVDESQSSNLADDLEYEATMLLKAETTGVVKLLALDRNRDPPCMITEYLPNKTVEYEYKLAEEKNDPESIFHAGNEHNIGNNVSNPVLLQMVRIARDVAGALARIHEIGIVHLDIAARNILLDLKKRPKIADFGCAAMEADMIEMYELRRVYSHEDLDIEELTKKDQDFPRKNRMYSMKRPIKWMPHWVVNNRNMPKIDKHTDVYSFGCFMYELAARCPPHALLPDKDVEDYKRVKPYNPTIPVDIDQRYTNIVQSCWEDYSNQPTMKDIATRLSELHSELATESVSETIQNDQGYWEFREIKPRMDIFRSKSLYSYSQSKSTTSTSSPPPPKVKSPLKEASLPSEKVSGRINLNFAHVDLSDAPPKLVEYELEGYDESRLQSALHSAFCLRDHQSIALTMLCINIENQEEQILMIAKCLEYIQLLAEDQHGSTDEDEAFEWLCRSILMIVKDASLTSKAIEQRYLGRLVGDALLALSSLLANKSLGEVSTEGTASLESELCSIVFDALRRFSRDETVPEKVAIAVASFCGLSQLIVKKLHADGTVLALLDALNVYAGNLQMALKLVKALSCFPIQCLIDCVQGEAKMGKGNKVLSSSGKTSKESSSSKVNVAKSEEREGEGVVYVNLFAIVRRCVHSLRRNKSSTTSEKGSDSDQELTLILLQNCLTSLFKMCESGMNDNDTINRLLHRVVAEDIEILVEIMQMFPDYFRMQEGAIGLLAHILSTGKAIPVTARELTSSAKTETLLSTSAKDNAFLLPKLPAEQRLVKYLELDQTLSLLLTAMETFKVNNRIAIGIATKSDAHKPTGIYSNDAYYQTSTTKRTVSTMTISKIRSLASDGDGGGDEKNDFYDDDDFDMDETGEPITAAALQRCVAIIIGIACNSRKLGKQVQENLVRTRYNENILSAFKTFARDVSLVRFGCQALFYTARRHDKHQQKLQHLYIFKHLISALLRHQSFPEVVEAVVCAFMGLLEPPDDVNVLPRDILENIRYTLGLETITKGGNVEEEGGASNVEQFKQLRIAEKKELNHRKRNFVGYSAATFLVANNQILTVQLGLGISGMSVLQLLAVFVANFEVREECQALVTSFLKLVCGIAFWLPEEAQAWSPDHIFVDLSVLKLNLLNRLFAKVIVNEIVNALKGNTTPTREKEKMGEGVAAIEEYGRPLSLIEYILRAMNMHKLSMNVISSSLTLFTAIFRSSLVDDDVIIGGEVTAYQDEESLISQHRQSLFSSLVPFCCFACFRREDNPILIRYSLWILIMFLAEKQPELENPTASSGVDTTGKMNQSKTIASQIAAQLSIDGLTEWAIVVATTFHDYYSLQILCSHFIIWMEYHNMLDSKSYQQLEEIITISKRNINTSITAFRSLDEEGHDTYLLGESIEVFGDLSIVSQRLLRIIESQLPLSHYSTINDNDRISSTQLQGNSEKPHLGFEKANEDQLFEEIAKELDVQLRFVRTVSANIKEWTTRNALDWFKEIFSGDSEETQRYLKKFQQSGITGKDLLIMEEKEFVQQLGIDLANHRKRFSLHLLKLQNYHEKHVTERLYYEMEMLYQERLLLEVRGSSPYQLPLSISTWKTFDIFVFLKLSGNEHLEKFLKPVALSELTGEQLLLISLPETEVKRKDPSSPISDNAADPEEPKPPHAKIETPQTNPDSSKKQNVIYLVGLEEDAEIEKLKVAIRNQKNTMEKRMQQEKQEAMNRLWKTLGAFDRKKLTILELLGQGSFGNVYRAQYEKKKVVVKQLMGSVMHRSKEQLVEDLKYEAMMLLEAATVGVIKLIAIDADNDPPRMVIEYLPNNTLEHEYQLAKLNDDSSIFHPENEFNVLEKETNGVYNPVLLQMVRIARDVAGALARIHEKGIVHLDIAARNILLDLKKRPKIADFGCAAMEADMIEMYEFFHSKSPMDVNVKARCENDEEFSRKYEMYSRQRPVRWMPYWAVEDTWSPRIDRSADVYAFGCLMYELTVQGIPHPDDSDEQVLKLKKDQRINPDSPRNIDHRYSAIMTSCWENYDRQPSMHTIALQLASLHTTVATENVIRDSFYSELRQVIRFSGQKVATNFPEILPVATSPTNRWREERGKRDHLDDTHRIFFSFDKTEFVIAVSKRQQLQHDGVPDDVLVNGLHCAHRFRDHQFIAFILQNILIKENDMIHSVEIICLCLELLEHLADDQHGSTNEEGTYQWLCAVIIEVMHSAIAIITAATTSTEGLLEEDNNYGARITGSALSTLGALLQNKSLPEHNLATEEQGFELQLCGIIFQAIRNYREDDFVAEKVAVAIFSFSGLSQVMVNKLHLGGAVGGLLEMLRFHHEKFEVAIDIVRALSCFPIQCLLEPMSILDTTISTGEESANAQSQKLQDQNTVIKSNSKPIVTSTFKGRKAAAIEKRLNKANQAVATSPSASNKSEKNSTKSIVKHSETWGQVFTEIFSFVKVCVKELQESRKLRTIRTAMIEEEEEDRDLEKEKEDDGDDELTVLLLETCLTSLFRICESGVNDTDLINKVLHIAKEDAISCLITCLQLFPQSFRIQEGSIGLLAHIVNTGIPVYIRDRSYRCIQTIYAPFPAESRLSYLLVQDPELRLIVNAMENFKVDDQIATGIREKEPDYVSDTSVSRSVYHTNTTAATMTAASRTKATKTSVLNFSSFIAPAAASGMDDNVSTQQQSVADEADELPFTIDETGDQITAAALQRSAAIILGIACNSRKEGKQMQDRLERSRYNETILLAFRNFRRDVSLIRFGCHALAFTCRRHFKHQEMLQKLSIQRHLYQALDRHKAIWEVVEAVICAVTGILEPPEDISEVSTDIINQVYKSMSVTMEVTISPENKQKIAQLTEKAIADKKFTYVGYWLAKELTKPLGKTSLLQQLAIMVVQFQINEECHLVVRSFLLLLCCIGFWLPEKMEEWHSGPKKFINLSLALNSNSRFKQQFFQMMSNANNLKLLSHFGHQNKTPVTSSAKASAEDRRTTAFEVLTASPPTPPSASLSALSNPSTTMTSYDINVVQFALLSLCWHRHNSDVLAAGLAIITATIRKSLPKHYQLGDEIADYAFPNREISQHRQTAMNTDLLRLCMEAAALQEDHPILIRYSLWLLLLFICQRNENPNDATDATLIASETSIGGCLEWAITVAKKYVDFYSLQVLATWFMYWMEYHGRFDNKDKDRLQEIKEVVEGNLKAMATVTTSSTFRPLVDEGTDTYLVGVTNKTFGDLKTASQKLLSRINDHLSGNVSSIRRRGKAGVTDTYDYRLWEAAMERSKPEIHLFQPKKIVFNRPRQVIPTTPGQKKYYLYEIDVSWSDVKRWAIERRFTDCLQLKESLMWELRHLDCNIPSNDLIKPTLGGVFVKALSPTSFLEKRRVLLQQWINELTNHRVIRHSEKFLTFANATINTDGCLYAKRLPDLNVIGAACSIVALHYCSVHRLLFIVCIVNSNQGKILVYSFGQNITTGNNASQGSWKYLTQEFHFCGQQEFTEPVLCLTYEPSRRAVIVGLTSGPVVVFFLTNDNKEFHYRTELNSHYSPVVAVTVDTTLPNAHYCISVGQAGSITSLNLSLGRISSQGTCPAGTKIYSLCYDPYQSVAFCGTDQAKIIVFDLKQTPAVELQCLNICDAMDSTLYQPQDAVGSVLSLAYDSKRRILYASLRHRIFRWRIFSGQGQNYHAVKENYQFLSSQAVLSLIPGAIVKSISLINDGQFLLVGEDGGGITIFDLFQPVHDTSRLGTLGGGSSSQAISWKDAVMMGTSAMLAWLHKHAVDTSVATTRDDVLHLIAEANNLSDDDVIGVLIPPQVKNEVFIAWSTVNRPETPTGSSGPAFNSTGTVQSMTIIPSHEYVLCGGKDGIVSITSLEEFILPASTTNVSVSLEKPEEIVDIVTDCRSVALKSRLIVNLKGKELV